MDDFFLITAMVGNTLTFSMMGLDKYFAVKGKWRISEGKLLLSALICGGMGALLGMVFFRHKTKKIKFKILLPIIAVFHFWLISRVFQHIYVYY